MRPQALIIISILVCLALLVYFNFIPVQQRKSKLQIENKADLAVDLAKTKDQQAKGLSGRNFLNDNEGMLFVFDSPQILSFWMKEMLFPIDIVWIKDFQIIDITENISPPIKGSTDESLSVYSPKDLADTALEVNAQWVKKNKIEIGDRVILTNY